MSAIVFYPPMGRGAWPSDGIGGTLNLTGNGPGRYYRAPATNWATPGSAGARAERADGEIPIDAYAVWRAATAIQVELHERGFTGIAGRALIPDGIWGPSTEAAVKAFQMRVGLTPDGVFGPASAKALFLPIAARVAEQVDAGHPELATIMRGTISLESGWDPGAVGRATPQDLGLGQINGPAHPKLSTNDRLNPKVALPYIARLIEANLVAFKFNTRDAIAAYNLGQAGARTWISMGRPQAYRSARPHEYIDKILAAG